MKRVRNRRYIRRNRPHKRGRYHLCATIIQRKFRAYMKRRYRTVCKNFDDDDCIELVAVSEIPKGLLMVVNGIAYSATGLAQWTMQSNLDPLTRDILPDGTHKECVSKIQKFLYSKTYGQRGFFRKTRPHRKLLKNLRKKDAYPCSST